MQTKKFQEKKKKSDTKKDTSIVDAKRIKTMKNTFKKKKLHKHNVIHTQVNNYMVVLVELRVWQREEKKNCCC